MSDPFSRTFMIGPSYGEWWKDTPARQRRRVYLAFAPAAVLLIWALTPYLTGAYLDDELLNSAAHGGAVRFRSLIQRGADVSTRATDGSSILLLVLEKDQRKLAELAIHHGADVNVADRHGVTPLHVAARSNASRIAVLLLKHGANVDAMSPRYGTPLHWAAHEGNTEVARMLLNAGASVNVEARSGRTPLAVAIFFGHPEAARLLLQHGADPDARLPSGRPVLHRAVIDKRPDLSAALLAHGAKVNARDRKGNTALHQAARRGFDRIAALLIEHGADVNAVTRALWVSPLHLAVENHHPTTVRLLLAAGANVNAFSTLYGTPLHWAATNGDRRIANILLAHGADAGVPDSHGFTAAARARRRGHEALATRLKAPMDSDAERSAGAQSAPHLERGCHFPARMHRISRQILANYLEGDLPAGEFRRRFSLPNSDYIELSGCVAGLYGNQ